MPSSIATSGAYGAGSASAGGVNSQAAGVFPLKAGAAMTANALAVLGPDSALWPVETLNFAKVSTRGATVFSVVPSAYNTTKYSRLNPLVHPSGDIYATSAAGTGGAGYYSSGLQVTRYGADGVALANVVVQGGSAITYEASISKLANDNIQVSWSDGTTLKFCILAPNLQFVKAVTNVEGIFSSQTHTAIPLSGGGFMIAYFATGAGTALRLAVYDNAGNVVTAASTINTFSGTVSGAQMFPNLKELSNGNIVFAGTIQTSSSAGTWTATLSPAGGILVAFTNIGTSDITSSVSKINIDVMPGYWCVSLYDVTTFGGGGGSIKARVFSNVGVLQGSMIQFAQLQPDGGGTNYNTAHTLCNDGVNFWLCYNYGGGTSFSAVKITTGGATTVYPIGTMVNNTNANCRSMDSFWQRNRLVVVYAGTGDGFASDPHFTVFNTVTLTQDAVNGGAVVGVTKLPWVKVKPVGDFCFLVATEDSDSGQLMAVQRWAAASIMGVIQADVNAAASVKLSTIGTYIINPIKGANPAAFDHSGSTITGNKGALLPTAAILKGLT